MFRMWGKVFADNHLLKDFVVENPSLDMTRTKKVFAALETIAHEFDLAVPIWLPSNISDFIDTVADMNNPLVDGIEEAIEQVLYDREILVAKKDDNKCEKSVNILPTVSSEPTDLEIDTYVNQCYKSGRILLKQKCHVVVATVGRLFDHIERGTIDLSQIKYFVLDEFDELTKTGFIEKVNEIINALPEERQNIFASATVPENIEKLVKKYLDEPFIYDYRFNLDIKQDGGNIEEIYICVDDAFNSWSVF